MKVTVSVAGKFHAFELAKGLYENGALESIITSYPFFKLSGEGIPIGKIISLPLAQILRRLIICLPFFNTTTRLDGILSFIFDAQASRQIGACDIFVGWSGASLLCLKKAKALGAITVLERGSAHIECQRDICQEEYRLWGLNGECVNPAIIEKELQEYRQADYISVPSLFAKRTFLEKGFAESKLICNPYGVDLSLYRPVPKEDRVFRVIYAGAMTVSKGIQYLLQAISELKLKGLELWLIGRMFDNMKPFFRRYKGHFRYLGHIDCRRLYRYYSQGSVFVLPSVQEGFGLVILQAMACGLPVICTENTAGPDIIRSGRDGFIVPIRNVGALKEKISYLYENQKVLLEMGISSKERVVSNFTWGHYSAKVLMAYNDCLKKGRRDSLSAQGA